MKAVYEMPRVNFEAFAADNSIADSCANQYTGFSCLRGDSLDNATVISDGTILEACTGEDVHQVGYQSIQYDNKGTIVNLAGVVNQNTGNGFKNQSSDYFDIGWNDVDSDRNREVVAEFKSGTNLIGFIYMCSNYFADSTHWGAKKYGDKWYWEHNGTGHDMGAHVMIAPIWSTNVNS